MTSLIATARSHSNIAFIKYWGNRNDALRLPENGSISMNLSGLDTITTVRFDETLEDDCLQINGKERSGPELLRVRQHLDNVRRIAGQSVFAEVTSINSFPTGAGVASSASAFAALTTAACAALGLRLSQQALTTVARLGSGSASRSIPGGYVEWYAGYNHDSSYADSIVPGSHWELIDLVAIVSDEHKEVGSTGGHALARTSPLQAARIAGADERLAQCRRAIQDRNFDALADVVEQDALLMHAVMLTSRPPLIYWQSGTLRLIGAVRRWREDGVQVCFTIDAGPNVHVITTAPYREKLTEALAQIDGVKQVLAGSPGGPTVLLDEHLTPASPHGQGTGIQV